MTYTEDRELLNILNRISKEEKIINAIKEGIKEAFIENLKNIDIDDAIESGVWSSFVANVPREKVLREIYFDAINKAHCYKI